jgi:hypothetical protein
MSSQTSWRPEDQLKLAADLGYEPYEGYNPVAGEARPATSPDEIAA